MRLLIAFILITFLPGLDLAPASRNDSEPQVSSQFRVDSKESWNKRSLSPSLSPSWEDRSRACEVFIGVDEILFNVLARNMTDVVQLAQDHVDELNEIFIHQVFDNDRDLYFRLSRVQVISSLCVGFDNCTEDIHMYLSISTLKYSNYCLNVIFTYLDFQRKLGIAVLGSLCKTALNTGVVSFFDQGQFMKFEKSTLVFAHEVGHMLGAHHDEGYKACKDKEFIMSKNITHVSKRQFSSCSIESMKQGHRNLPLTIGGVDDCFVNLPANGPLAVETSLCGNGIVEPGEECDCGSDLETCGQLCYPAQLSVLDRWQNPESNSCHVTPQALQM